MKIILQKQGRFLSVLIMLAFLSSLAGPVVPTLAADVPPAPTIIGPDNGVIVKAVGSGVNVVLAPPAAIPEFSWQAVPGATNYRIQFAKDIGFTNNLLDFYTNLTHFIPTNALQFSDGAWFWRVRVESPTIGNYSEVPNHRSFTRQWASPENIPTLASPANGALIEFFNAPTFSWQPVVGAARYRLEIATTDNFTQPTPYETIATTFQPTTKLANGTYYWRVIPLDPANRNGTPSASRSFLMYYGKGPGGGGVLNTDRVPDLITPENNSFPTFTPTFSWTAVEGAQFYRLEYSTDPNILTNIVRIDTSNTTYTPANALPNDKNYYWHVRAHSDLSVSDWSPTWTFQKQWYIEPVLLTPTNNFQNIRIPTFSWTPVPGAAYYRIEIDDVIDFVTSPLLTEETSNPFYTPREWQSTWTQVYWRIVPFDSEGNKGKESQPSFFASDATKLTPELISPQYYYTPNSFPPPFDTVMMQPYSDRTVALPVFYWHRLTAYPGGETAAAAYRFQIAENNAFSIGLWQVDTQNTHVAPTLSHNFVPSPLKIYYWRVRGLDNVGNYVGNWSQTWRVRIDLQPTNGQTSAPPQLRRPITGAEIVEATPVLEWWPVTGADNYEVQISLDSTFATVTNSDFVPYPVYSPLVSLAQRSLLVLNYGTYYWRVQARTGTSPLGSWSEVRRFQVASQSGRLQSRTMGNLANRLQIASDPDDKVDNNFELTTLSAAQDSGAWYFGFKATATATNMTYALYIDRNHIDNSGGSADPRGYTVTTIPAHRPEYVLYIDQVGSTFTTTQTELRAWNGIAWGDPSTLDDIGGSLYYDSLNGYVEVKVPNTAIGMSENTGSYALSLLSLPATASAAPEDSVPSDPTVPGGGPISRFASTSERMNAIVPVNTPQGDATAYPSILPFEWDNPAVTNGTAPWAGGWTRVYIDPGFTTEKASYQMVSNTPYYSFVSHHWSYDFVGDNTYYWRIQPCYLFNGVRVCGAWNQGGRFERRGFLPTSLTESVTFATPTFSWSMVEGARYYDLQVDNDQSFFTPEVDIRTAQNSFTPTYTLNEGTYYWRVRVIRYNDSQSAWTTPKIFTLTLPKPTGLTPNDPNINNAIDTTPTFCWQPLLVSSNSVPVLAAYRYRVQISMDPNFPGAPTYDTEQDCFTPQSGYPDGQYYWRVAMIDGQGKAGGYSTAATFWKQYPMAKPLSPVDGGTISQVPTFIWTANDGVTPYVFGAASYRLEIRKDSPTANPIETITTSNTRYIPTSASLYELNKTYYWRVAIIDVNGNIGPFNDAMVIINPFSHWVFLPMVTR